jgi:hypothetical protein
MPRCLPTVSQYRTFYSESTPRYRGSRLLLHRAANNVPLADELCHDTADQSPQGCPRSPIAARGLAPVLIFASSLSRGASVLGQVLVVLVILPNAR